MGTRRRQDDHPRPGVKTRPIFLTLVFVFVVLVIFVLKTLSSSTLTEKAPSMDAIRSEYVHALLDKTSTNIEEPQDSVVKMHELTPKSDNFIWVRNATGDFKSRIKDYNKAIDKLRTDILDSRQQAEWKDFNGTREVLWCNRDDFMTLLNAFSHVTTVVLPWILNSTQTSWSTLTDTQNVLVNNYYEWTATEPLCTWIQTAGLTKARWDAVYNKKCNIDTSKAFQPTSLEHVYFYGKPINPRDYWPNEGFSYPEYFYDELPDRVLYLHVMQDGIITGAGDVLSGNLKLVPYTCSQQIDPAPPVRYEEKPIYSEVFVITQFWGDTFYHKMNEVLPRIAPYMDFLQNNPKIKIHVAEEHGYTKGSLKFLGFAPERIITGTTRAKVVYLPQATPCGFAQAQSIQLLSELYRSRIHKDFAPLERNLVILIERSDLRHFHQRFDIEVTVEKTASAYGFEYVKFGDRPVPSMEQAMQMFAQAVMVVAPHGAGLSNVIYSEPGTFIIEGVCNRPHVNMCYQWTSHVLGHRYHAIPSRQGCEGEIDIEPAVIEFVMSIYLEPLGKDPSLL